ncbi:MAG: hypothetical protein J3Q66DRAFT_440021 [Benniella sp.]|nr:MAG: hypothetical protein J3Q66DRAFT_440021 [Benniella sp.]
MKNIPLATGKRAVVLLLLTTHFSIDAGVIPPARWGHVSVLCGNQLYIHGGHTGVNPITAPIGSDLYSLDVSVAFNIFSVPWAQLTPGPYASFHSVGLLGSGNSLLAIYGGNTSFASTPSSSPNSLHLYNTATGSWTPSPLQDPPRRSQQTAVSRLGDGTMFVFGGLEFSADLQQGSSTSELWTLGGYMDPNSNTTGSTSSNSSSSTVTPSAPVPPGLSPGTVGWQKMSSPQGGTATDRSFHTATLLRSNGLLVIIGGVSGGSLASMSEILVYDTGAGTWSVQTATGATPPLRRNHVAAATSTGQIYIHGGTDLGGTNFFADVAILDTTSWSWKQPPIEGSAPTGRYSHAATMVGSNMIVSFGLTAGGATNNMFILDTTTNTWQASYTPSNLQQTSTKPEDWPGYKPPPILPTPPPTDPKHPTERSSPTLGSVVGIVAGVVAFSLVLFTVIKRHRRNQMMDNQAKMASLYGPGFVNQRSYSMEEPYRPTGMAFGSTPMSFGQKMDQIWGGLGAVSFWRRDRRAASRSQSQRLEEQDDDGGMRGLEVGPITDQDIFLDAVHRARSRAGGLSPVFAPLSASPRSPRSPNLTAVALTDSPIHSGVVEYIQVDGGVVHGRTYSDGFERTMQEIDVQMVSVPKGRLYVVNPSDEVLGTGDQDDNDDEDRDQSRGQHAGRAGP